MGKREIKVKIIGKPSEESLNNYYNIIWRTIEDKYGIEFLLEIKRRLQQM